MYAKFFCAVSCPQGIPEKVLYTFITNAVFGTGLAVHTILGLIIITGPIGHWWLIN